MKKPLVAIVDDDSAFASYLRTFLSLRGYETRAYSRGDEMLAAIRQGDPPDIVLLDVMMPGMDGLETLRNLKTARPELQAIMLSGRERAATIVEAVQLGAANYVIKPDDPEGLGEVALEAAIKSAIEKSQLVTEINELRRQLSDDEDRAFLFWGDSPEMSTIATVTSTRSLVNGFSMKSKAPSRVACMASVIVPCPEIMATGSDSSRRLISARVSRPLVPGILMSRTTMSGGSVLTCATPSAPEAAPRNS